jgi:polyisoprenoid-binding protein YceI
LRLAPDARTAHLGARKEEPMSTWTLDAGHSNASFAVRHLMISNVRGEFSKLSGEATYDPAHPEAAKLEVKIEVGSISTRDEKRDGHLRSADFFDAEKYPYITFKSKSVKRKGEALEVIGDLTIRDASREVTLKVDELTAEHPDPWGNKRVGATASTKIKRSDFGMSWNSALEAGGVVVGDEVTIHLDAEFIKKA